MPWKNRCCVPLCDRLERVVHRFPKFYEDVYNTWVERVGVGNLKTFDPEYVYMFRVVCDKHFSKECKIIGSKRLKIYSVPTLFLPGGPYEHCLLFPSASVPSSMIDNRETVPGTFMYSLPGQSNSSIHQDHDSGNLAQDSTHVFHDNDYINVQMEAQDSTHVFHDHDYINVQMETSPIRTEVGLDVNSSGVSSELITPCKKRQRRLSNKERSGYNKSPQLNCLLELKARVTTSKPTKNSPPNPQTPCDGFIFKSHESDCKKYYICNQGKLSVQTCPSGLFWNENHCDWPENTKCHPDHPNSGVEVVESPPVVIESQKPTSGTNGYKVVCYFTNWAWYRQGDGKYKPENIDSNLCTHITYGFAVLDSNSLTIKPHDSWADIDNQFYAKVTALKQKGIKVLLALGGWNDSLGDKYSRLVNNPSARAKFVTHALEFVEKWNFDGLDLDWEYPKCWQVDCSKGPDSDKSGFAALVSELSAALRPKGLLLSSAVSPSKTVIDHGYDVRSLSQHFDWIAVMTYDFHGHWDKQTGHVAPLYYYPNDTYDYFNANFSLNYWIEKGAPPSKIIMGLPLYGQSFTLADEGQRGLGAKSYGPGEAGEFTRAGGFLAFYEICERIKRRNWVVTRDPEGRIGPYASHGNQWVSYDDISEVKRKTKLIKDLKLGGGMI